MSAQHTLRRRTIPPTALPPLLIAGLILASAPSLAGQVEWSSSRPDGHAPIGVMGDHLHSHGEWMLSYRYMRMAMAGNRDGTERIETDEVHKDFMVAPLDMAMRMHMAGLMYAPSDAVTLMATAHWLDNSMNLVPRAGEAADVASSGVGDIGVSALIGIRNAGSVRAHLNAGVSIPVGSIEEMGVTPMSMGEEVQLPYPMQIGSGSWDLTPGLTVLGMTGRTSWGAQGKAKLRLNENSRGYRRGHELETTAWFALRASELASLSGRTLVRRWGNHSGRDAAYHHHSMMVPTVREDLRGGTRVDIPLGLNLYVRSGPIAGHRIAVEWHLPVYQNLNGPQLETDWVLTVGWQKAFEPIGHH